MQILPRCDPRLNNARIPRRGSPHAIPSTRDRSADPAVLQGEAAKPWFLAVGFLRPHLPFVSSQQFFDLYPPSVVQPPPDQQPPQGMPPVAWQSYGELRSYADQAAGNYSGAAGTVLPASDMLALRRAYYASVSMTDAFVGKVMRAFEKTPFVGSTVISIWGDHVSSLSEREQTNVRVRVCLLA